MYYTPRMPHLYPITLPQKNYPQQWANDAWLELATIKHERLLREQAQIQRYKLTNPSSITPVNQTNSFRDAYKQQVEQKQQRIIQLLNKHTSNNRQQQLQRNLLLEDQLNYQQMLQQMELDRYSLLHSRKTARLNTYKPHSHIFATIDNTLPYDYKINQMKQGDRYKSIDGKRLSETFQGINLYMDRSKMNKKQKLLRQYQKNSWSNHSVGKENEKIDSKLQGVDTQSRTDSKNRMYLDLQQNRRSQSVKQHKMKQKVSFDLSSNIITSQPQKNSLSLQPKHLQSNYSQSNRQIPQIDFKQSGQTKIKNRIALSNSIYRDSQLKNIKHEHIHLISTYHNELKLRHGLKTRINNNPKVIDKYSIVVQPNL